MRGAKGKMPIFYTVIFHLNKTTYYSLWFSDKNDKDQFLTNGEGVVFFSNCKDLAKYVSEKGLNATSDQTFYDVDVAINWLAENYSNIDCEYILALWNVAGDLAYSVNRGFTGNSSSETIRSIYDKLFWGNNLPALRGDGDIFVPQWSSNEIHELQIIVSDMVSIIKSAFSKR